MNDLKIFIEWDDAVKKLESLIAEHPQAHIEETQYRYIIVEHKPECPCGNCPLLRDDGSFRSH